ncbi:MAG: cadherin repeat domain-containing protein, partial [Thermodesulfobacteriota bacterium]
SEQSVFLAINDLDDEGDDDDDDPPPADETPPTILSGATAPAIDENSGAGQVVYTVTSDDDRATYSLGASGDSASFSIDQDSGVVIFSVDPDFESQESYIFNVLATDPAGNSSEQLVSLSINDLDDDPPPVVDETPPTISSGAIAPAIDENSGAGQVVYTVTSDDGAATYSLGSSPDSAAFSIDAASGEVRLLVDPDFESQESYIFNVLATDPAGNSSEQPVSLAINDLDEEDPDITALNVGTEAGPDSSIVVFDLVAGQSSDHSGRTFSAEVEYSIYIMVDSDGLGLQDSGAGWGVWSGADNLGADDTVVIVGDSGLIDPVPSYQAGAISDGAMLVAGDQLRLSAGFSIPDYTEDGGNFSVIEGLSVGSDGLLQRWGESVSEQYSSTATTADLWNGTISDFRASGSPDHYLAAMPAGLLTSQGLA